MAERPWEWELPAGEKLVAKVDSSGVESVYLGSHLVSRAARGLKATGHEIRGHGGADGAYRGAKDMRVFFEDEGCRLVIDGETMKRAPPPPPPTSAPPLVEAGTSNLQKPAVRLALVLLLVAVFVGLAFLTYERPRSRNASQPAPARAAERLPSTQTHSSANGLLTIHYPSNFDVKEASVGPGGSVVQLDAKEGYETLSFFAWSTSDTTDLWKLDDRGHKSAVETWGRAGTRFVGGEERRDGKCHGEDAAIVVRHVSTKDGTNVRVWTCTFIHDHHAFRFVTFTLEAVTPDDAYLNSILDAAEL